MKWGRATSEALKPSLAGRMGGKPWRQLLRWVAFLGYPWRSRPRRQLRLCESLALGERRFLSVVEFGEQRFLVGGTGTSLALLAVLPGPALPEGRVAEEVAVWEFVNGRLTRRARCG